MSSTFNSRGRPQRSRRFGAGDPPDQARRRSDIAPEPPIAWPSHLARADAAISDGPGRAESGLRDADPLRSATHIVVMGVAGSGKTTIAELLAERLGWSMAEADDFHDPDNIAKMSSGIPLADEDRWAWLETIRDWLGARTDAGQRTIITCSALKRSYRDVLRDTPGGVTFLHLDGPPEVVLERMRGRTDHFMPVALLPSQFALLEELGPDENGATVSITDGPERIVDTCIDVLGLASR